MKPLSSFFGVAAVIAVALFSPVASAATFEKLSVAPSYTASTDDTLNVSKKMRVVFIPSSTYKNFKIGIESSQKTDVNIQVMNSKGMVVYSDLQEKVSKKLAEIDFSFLKKGEYTVKVSSQDDAYTKILVIP